MSKSSLLKLASQFETKLGISSPKETVASEGARLPKSLKKIAQAQQGIKDLLAAHKAEFLKVASGPTVKCSFGTLPAVYSVCSTCKGLGKLALNRPNPNLKFASTEEFLEHMQLDTCHNCDGKRVVKAIDKSRCSPKQLAAYAAEKEDKDSKKAAKLKAKAEKAERKAEEKKLALEDPEKYAQLKSEKKEGKSKKKAVKKFKKASKKAEKAKKKVFNFFGKGKAKKSEDKETDKE